MKTVIALLLIGALALSCATSGQPGQSVVSTPRETVDPVHTAGGVSKVIGGILGVLSLNPINMVGGIVDLMGAPTAFDKSVNNQTTLPAPADNPSPTDAPPTEATTGTSTETPASDQTTTK